MKLQDSDEEKINIQIQNIFAEVIAKRKGAHKKKSMMEHLFR